MRSFRTDGCVALPSPRPAWVSLAFPANATAATDAALAALWVFTDPDLVANCTPRVLECSDPEAADTRIFPDPFDPIRVPSVQCPPQIRGAAAAAPPPAIVVLSHGSDRARRCPLLEGGCVWDAAKQRFVGPECAWDLPTECACR